jgi:hypothetical protein
MSKKSRTKRSTITLRVASKLLSMWDQWKSHSQAYPRINFVTKVSPNKRIIQLDIILTVDDTINIPGQASESISLGT